MPTAAGGFFDAVATRSGTIARRYLSLDQAMVMGALGNVLGRDVLRRAFSTKQVEKALRPVIGIERVRGRSLRRVSRPTGRPTRAAAWARQHASWPSPRMDGPHQEGDLP